MSDNRTHYQLCRDDIDSLTKPVGVPLTYAQMDVLVVALDILIGAYGDTHDFITHSFRTRDHDDHQAALALIRHLNAGICKCADDYFRNKQLINLLREAE